MVQSGVGEKPRVGGAEGRAVCTGQEGQELGLEVEEGFCDRASSTTISSSDILLRGMGNHRRPLIRG